MGVPFRLTCLQIEICLWINLYESKEHVESKVNNKLKRVQMRMCECHPSLRTTSHMSSEILSQQTQCQMCSHIIQMFSSRFGLFVTALIVTVNYIAANQYKIVETFNGQVRGIQKKTLWNGIPFYAFKGIPFAKPPVGDLRLKVQLFIWLFLDYLLFVYNVYTEHININSFFLLKNRYQPVFLCKINAF